MKKHLGAILVLVLAGAATLAVVSCSTSSSDDPAVGTWNMTKEGSVALPSTNINSGNLVVSSNNTWTSTTVLTPAAGGSTEHANGTWSVSGSTYAIVQTSGSGDTGSATISGSTMILTMTAGSYTFVKQ